MLVLLKKVFKLMLKVCTKLTVLKGRFYLFTFSLHNLCENMIGGNNKIYGSYGDDNTSGCFDILYF